MKKKIIYKKSKRLQTQKKTMNNSFCFMAVNSTQKILDYLKEKYEFQLNRGNQKMEFRLVGEEKFNDLTDTDFNSIKVALNLENIACSKENLKVILFSNQWPQYDPYKDYLNSLPEWDGHDYIADLAATVHTDDDQFWEWCLRKWFVALVGSLAEEEAVNQTAIILCGKQGVGKSTWLLRILPTQLRKYYSSGFLDPKDKETKIQLSELCIYNMDEVENLKPKNVEAIKELITKPSMYLRRAYTTLSQNYPRRCSFCGTANGVNILHDITGNRRFLCQNVISIDYQLKDFNLDQLYAQAFQLFRTGFQYWLDAKEQAIVEKHNARFRAASIEEELIDTYLEPCQDGDKDAQRRQAHELQTYLKSKAPYATLSPVTIGKILSSKGFKTKKVKGISKWIVRVRIPDDDNGQ